jgi:hypothetical protein
MKSLRSAGLIAIALSVSLLASCAGQSRPARPPAAANAAPKSGVAALASQLTAHADFNLPGGWSDTAKFVVEKVTGAMIGNLPPPLGKFSTVLLEFFNQGGAKTAQLDALKQQLDAIQAQIHDLQNTMDAALKIAEQTRAITLAADVKALRDKVLSANADLLEAFGYAGRPDKKGRADELVKDVKGAVDGYLKEKTLVVPEAILGSAVTPRTSSLYEALSDVFTHSHKDIFTWRDSVALDNVFQYLVDLQALQYNLIVQVFVMENSDANVIYQRFSEPYLGDKGSFKFTTTDVTYLPTKGWLHDELANELTRVPQGLMVDTHTGLEWSTDVPTGAREPFTLQPAGPGFPQCPKDGVSDPPPACITDPRYSLGPTYPETGRWPDSPADQVAKSLESRGYGKAAEWKLPTTQQLDTLFDTHSPNGGSAKTWLEARSHNPNPATCKPVTAGGDVAIKDPATCLWLANKLWPVNWPASDTPGGQLIKDVYGCHGSGLSYRCDVLYRRFPYGWQYQFVSLTEGSRERCDLVTQTLAWQHHDSVPSGPTWNPPGSASCSGALVLVRQLQPSERYYF